MFQIKLKIDYLVITAILIITSLFLFPLFRPEFYDSHDGEAHVARFAAYIQSFQDGQFPPRWAGNLNFSYGTPLFIFYYPLPGYLASFLSLTGLSLENIFKFIIGLNFIIAPVFFYLWAKLLFRKEVAFLGALLYAFAPYHFLDLYVRGDVAEVMALALVPLVFFCIEKLLIVRSSSYMILGGISYALLILSHNGISLMFSPIFLLYVTLRSEKKKDFLLTLPLFCIGLVLSAFFWLPALYESRYTNIHLFVGDMYKNHFPTVRELIYSPWGFGPDVRQSGGLSPQIGFLYVLMTVLSIFVVLKEKKQQKQIYGWLAVFFMAVFISLSLSHFVWGNLSLLRVYEFPWRFTALSSFAAVILSCYVLSFIKNKKIFVGFFLLIIVVSIPFIKVKHYVTRDDAFYKNFTGTTYYHGEANPIWTAGDPTTFPELPIEIVGGEATIDNFIKKTNNHTFTLTANNRTIVLDNTQYFPGWKVSVDGKNTPIQFQDPNYRGLITFQVPSGEHKIEVKFTESPIRLLSNTLSIVAILVVSIILIMKLFKRRLLFLKKPLLYNKSD